MPDDELSKEDWQFIHYATQARINQLAPRPGEPPASPSTKAEWDRIMRFLDRRAFPRTN